MLLKLIWKRARYELDLKAKYTVIQGMSGTGKSTMWNLSEFDVDSNYPCDFVTAKYKDRILHDTYPRDYVLFFDEDLAAVLSDNDCKLLHKLNCYCIFITRHVPPSLPVDYREIYYFATEFKKHVLKRCYSDLETFTESGHYVCEDAKSGYQYFSNRLNNVDHADGISNVEEVAKPNSLAIIDGAACGAFISVILNKCNVFAPISFEYLCYKKIAPHSDLISNPYEHWDFSKYKSLEEMFTHELNKLTTELGYHYSKEHCPIQIKQLDLLPMQTNPKTVWSKYCKHFGIINEEAEFQRLKNLYKVSDDELFRRLEEDFL